MKSRLLLLFLGLWIGSDVSSAQAPADKKQPDATKPEVVKHRHDVKHKDGTVKTYWTGRVPHPNLPQIKRLKAERLGYLTFPKVTAPQWDCAQLGLVPPIWDQGQCGSCWDFSGNRVVTCALIKAGYGKPDGSFLTSTQYVLDCGNNGGCNGDDNITVLDMAKSKGLPLASDYGPYTASSGRCKYNNQKLYQIKDWGFCDNSGQGVAATQKIKDAIAQYGPVGAAIDANVLGDGTGIVSGGGHSIDHDITITGWDDTKGKNGCWIMDNSWGNGWGVTINGVSGRCYIEYGSGDIGTEACWATATALPPPVPPGPGPAPPPGPVGPGPVITSALTAAGQVGAAFSYQITASGSPTAYAASGLPAGLTVSTSTGFISGTPTAAAVSSVTIIAANSGGAGSATLTLTVTSGPPVPANPSITLSSPLAAGTYEIVPSGSVVITADMTLKEIIDKVNKVKAGGAACCGLKPCYGEPPPAPSSTDQEIKALKRGLKAVMDWIEMQKPKKVSKP